MNQWLVVLKFSNGRYYPPIAGSTTIAICKEDEKIPTKAIDVNLGDVVLFWGKVIAKYNYELHSMEEENA